MTRPTVLGVVLILYGRLSLNSSLGTVKDVCCDVGNPPLNISKYTSGKQGTTSHNFKILQLNRHVCFIIKNFQHPKIVSSLTAHFFSSHTQTKNRQSSSADVKPRNNERYSDWQPRSCAFSSRTFRTQISPLASGMCCFSPPQTLANPLLWLCCMVLHNWC